MDAKTRSLKYIVNEVVLIGLMVLVVTGSTRNQIYTVNGSVQEHGLKENESTQEHMFALHSSLLRYYDTNVVPRNNFETVNVNITFYLMSLLRFDEREETLISAAWLSIMWEDRFLRWLGNPKFDNITEIFLKQSDIWKPDVRLINTVEHFKSLGSDELVVLVEANGKVTWEPGHRFKTACSLNINLYPFDSQQCSISFSTWMHVDDVVILSSVSDKIEFDHFEENGEWQIISTSAESNVIPENGYGLPRFNVTLVLHRRRMYYVLTVCVPIIVLSILNCMVYLLPSDSGEKISFCLTILLAYMVYISFLSDNLPRTSNTTSYLVVYLALMICLSFLSVMNSVIVLLFWHKSDEPKNSVKDKLILAKSTMHQDSNRSCNCNDVSHECHHAISGKRPSGTEDNKTNNKMIAKRLDRIMFISMSTLTASIAIANIVLLLQS